MCTTSPDTFLYFRPVMFFLMYHLQIFLVVLMSHIGLVLKHHLHCLPFWLVGISCTFNLLKCVFLYSFSSSFIIGLQSLLVQVGYSEYCNCTTSSCFKSVWNSSCNASDINWMCWDFTFNSVWNF